MYAKIDDVGLILGLSNIKNEALVDVTELGEFVRVGKTITECTLNKYKFEGAKVIDQMAEASISQMRTKYKLTDATGMTTKLGDEAQKYEVDNTSPTPNIDAWCLGKGRDKALQIEKILTMLKLTQQMSIVQELGSDCVEDATTTEQIDRTFVALKKLQGCLDKTCFFEKYDEVVSELRAIAEEQNV